MFSPHPSAAKAGTGRDSDAARAGNILIGTQGFSHEERKDPSMLRLSHSSCETRPRRIDGRSERFGCARCHPCDGGRYSEGERRRDRCLCGPSAATTTGRRRATRSRPAVKASSASPPPTAWRPWHRPADALAEWATLPLPTLFPPKRSRRSCWTSPPAPPPDRDSRCTPSAASRCLKAGQLMRTVCPPPTPMPALGGYILPLGSPTAGHKGFGLPKHATWIPSIVVTSRIRQRQLKRGAHDLARAKMPTTQWAFPLRINVPTVPMLWCQHPRRSVEPCIARVGDNSAPPTHI